MPRPARSRITTLIPTLLCAALAGCSTYRPDPLPRQIALPADSASLRVDTVTLALPRLAGRRIDLSEPLGIDAVAALAVLNDPRLRIARDRRGVAQAQAFAAGLLPDPQFSASRDIPQADSGATTSAYNVGLALDLSRLITRPAAVAAARADLRSVDLNLLWQEWQTAADAELAYVRLVGLRQRDAVLDQEREQVTERLGCDRRAAADADLPRAAADADLVELQGLEQRLADDGRTRLQQQAALDALLGLAPTVALDLADLPPTDPESLREAKQVASHLDSVRPDLLALRAGYASQEQSLRRAVLAQFPSVSVGFSRARDTSNVHTLGFNVGFSLPLLDGSRGDIAVARASRAQLRDEDLQRMAAAHAEVQQALANVALLQRQRDVLRTALPALERAAQASGAALQAGDTTLAQAQAQRAALLEQRLAIQGNAQQIAEQTVALQLLTGRGVFADAALPHADHD